MNILAIGDIVGSIGCRFLREKLPSLKKKENIDLVIANGENSADGNGITPSSANFIFSSGVDVITAGNHTFRRRESYSLFDSSECLLRPANFPDGTTPGHGFTVYDFGRTSAAVINLMGCMYMESLNDPYMIIDSILKQIDSKIIILDFHAEATAEKLALAYYLDGRISAMFGTHTHVQTADAQILPGGTGFITDVGMTGPVNSVIGVSIDAAIEKMKTKMPVRLNYADGKCMLNAVIFAIDEKSGKTMDVERINISN